MKDFMEIIALGLDEKGESMSANILSILDSVKMSIGGIEPDCTDFDLQIIFLTLKKVLKLEGVNREGEATNIAFKGNE